MILRRSRSVAPPQTPSFSRTVMACSKHDAFTMQELQIDLASSAAASESGKKTSGSKPLQAPWCRHDRSVPDIEIPLDHGESPRAGSVCVNRHICPFLFSQMANGYRIWVTGEGRSGVRCEFHLRTKPSHGNSADRTVPRPGHLQTARPVFR